MDTFLIACIPALLVAVAILVVLLFRPAAPLSFSDPRLQQRQRDEDEDEDEDDEEEPGGAPLLAVAPRPAQIQPGVIQALEQQVLHVAGRVSELRAAHDALDGRTNQQLAALAGGFQKSIQGVTAVQRAMLVRLEGLHTSTPPPPEAGGDWAEYRGRHQVAQQTSAAPHPTKLGELYSATPARSSSATSARNATEIPARSDDATPATPKVAWMWRELLAEMARTGVASPFSPCGNPSGESADSVTRLTSEESLIPAAAESLPSAPAESLPRRRPAERETPQFPPEKSVPPTMPRTIQ